MGVAHIFRHRQHRFLAGKRLADDRGEEAGRRLVGPAGPHADRGEAQAHAVEKTAAVIIGEQQLADRLLGSIRGQRGEMELVVDRFGKRRAEHGGRGGEHQLGVIALARLADGFEQRARAVEIDAVAFVEIRLGFARHHGGEVEDHVGPPRDHGFGLAGGGQIRGDALDFSGESRRLSRGDDIDQHQLVDGFAIERLVANEPLTELAADHPGRPDDQHLHVMSPSKFLHLVVCVWSGAACSYPPPATRWGGSLA